VSLANRNPLPFLLSRRQALGTAGALVGAGLTGGLAVAATPDGGDPLRFDFTKPEDNLKAWVKLVAALDGRETCGYYKGDVVAVTGPDQKNLPLFGYEGFGMSRVTRLPDGRYENLHREISYYTDLRTGAILESWQNPLTGETVKVYPTNNDPVNSHYATTFKQTFGEAGKQETVEFPFILPWEVQGDRVIVTFNVHTRWPSPFTRDQWPREYIGEWYKTSELFQIHARMSELADPSTAKAYSTSAWFKEAPFIPWMLMDNAPGRLIYNTRIFSLAGPHELPGKIQDYTAKHYPKFLKAPDKWESPNMTTFETWVTQMTPAPPRKG